jgi:hypothetical protein
LTTRVPAHQHGIAGARRLDHRVFVDAKAQALAGLDDVVAEVAVAGQPGAPFDHAELAAEPAEVQGLARGEAANGHGRLRIHHQSPVFEALSSLLNGRQSNETQCVY